MSEPSSAVAARRRAPVRVWVALVVAAVCAVYEVLAGALVEWTGLGFLPLLLVPPLYIVAILLLVWVGQQGVRRARAWAVAVGVLLALSLPIAVVVTMRTWN